jgi:hypothetical protein
MKTLGGLGRRPKSDRQQSGLRMRELDLHHIPAVARRIARDELATRISVLEAELAKEQATSTDLVKQITSAREELEALRKAQTEREAEIQTLTSTLSRMSAEAEELRAGLAEREVAGRANEMARSETEARLVQVAREFKELQLQDAERLAKIESLQSTLARSEADARTSEEERGGLEAQLEGLSRQLDEIRLTEAARDAARSNEEIATCKALADKCVFVVGFARSNTTITLEILNCAANALILGEAEFFLGDRADRFSDWYNEQHRDFQNQITKSTHAPDFLPDTPHSWWQWLDSAAGLYDRVGEKVALSDYQLSQAPPDTFRAFYEARFLNSCFIFMLRNPIDVLLSSAKLMSIVDDAGMARLCAAWLDFIELWADFIRVFPRTATIVCERFGESTIDQLEAFTGLGLGDARLLINPANKRRHKLTGKFPTLVRLRAELQELYADAVAAADESRALWQAEQKRNTDANETRGNAPGSIAMTPRPLGRVWLRVQELREVLSKSLNEIGQ